MDREKQPVISNFSNIYAHLITSDGGSMAKNPDSSSLKSQVSWEIHRKLPQASGFQLVGSPALSPSLPRVYLLQPDLLVLSVMFCLTYS